MGLSRGKSWIIALWLLSAAGFAQAQVGSAFTYQGRLKDSGGPANGPHTIEFKLYDAAAGGNQVGPTLTFDGNALPQVSVTDGLFTVELDFGATAYSGAPRWLDIRVNGAPLAPRQALTATPHARWASQAATAQSVPWAGVTDVPPNVSGAFSPWSLGAGHGKGWGANYAGQATVPTGMFIAVSAGGDHSLGLRSDGTLAGWGANFAGQATVPAGTFVAVSAGGNHSLAIKSDGTLSGWGYNTSGQATVPAGTFIAVSAGYAHSLALKSDGTLVGWGDNFLGQTTVPAGTFIAVSAGGNHSLALKSDGTLVGWGDNFFGQATVPAGTFIAISAGGGHSLALKSDGTLVSWGRNDFGEATVPAGTFIAISAGDLHSLALRSDGTLAGWGDNFYGQTTVPAGTFLAVSAGSGQSLAIETSIAYSGSVEAGSLTAGEITATGNLTIGNQLAIGAGSVHPNFRMKSKGGSGQWKGGVAAGGNAANVALGELDGVAQLGGHNAALTAWADLAINSGGGNVGIGTTSPGQRLQVNGNICATGTIGVCSDARFKQNVRSLTGALDQVLRLRGVSFEWNRAAFRDRDFAAGPQVGFIAQEVEAVVPQVVQTGGDGYRAVDYGRLTPLLVEALKESRREQAAQLAGRDARISALEADNAALKARLDALEARWRELSDARPR